MRILAIRFARLGDVILLLQALTDLKASLPESHLTLLTGHRCAPIGEMCPSIDEVISVDRLAMREGPWPQAIRGMLRLARDIRRRKFDLVVDFHSFRETNLLTWISGARWRLGMKRFQAPYWSWCFNTRPVLEDKRVHVAKMFKRVVQGIPGLPPATETQMPVLKVATAATDRPQVALYVDAPVPERIWPPKHFAQVADEAIEKWNTEVAVLASPEGKHLAEQVKQTSRNSGAITTYADLNISELAARVASARLFISNDTGPMHLGPALGVPTIGLFSVGYPEHFRPTGPHDQFLRANAIDKIEVASVIEAMNQMWATVGRDLRR